MFLSSPRVLGYLRSHIGLILQPCPPAHNHPYPELKCYPLEPKSHTSASLKGRSAFIALLVKAVVVIFIYSFIYLFIYLFIYSSSI